MLLFGCYPSGRDCKRLTGNCRIGMWGQVPKLGSFETVRFELLISGEKMCLTVQSSLFILLVVKCWSSTQCRGGFENPVEAFKLRSGQMAWSRNVSWAGDANVTVTTASSSLPLFYELLPSAVAPLTGQRVVRALKCLFPQAGNVLSACWFFVFVVSLSGAPTTTSFLPRL